MLKKLIISLIALIPTLFAQAQTYRPRDTWPYEQEEFQEGVIRTTKGDLLEDVRLNVCIVNGCLHFLKDKTIMEADMSTVFTARVGEETYVNVGGKMHRVLSENEHGAVIELTEVDMDNLAKADIGYGISSATASTQKTSLELMGGMDGWGDIGLSGRSYHQAFEERGNGQVIPLLKTEYLLVNGFRIEAAKKAVLHFAGVDQAAGKAFFKANKIKWNRPESLMSVIDFIYGQLNPEQ